MSDTRVSRKRAYFVDNWDVFVEEMRRACPDLIVDSGDVSFDGATDEDDLAFGKDRLTVPWIAIPGNMTPASLPSRYVCSSPSIRNEWAVGSVTTGRAGGAVTWVPGGS